MESFKNSLLQNRWAKFNQTWHKLSMGKGDSNLFKKGIASLQGEKIAKE
jgi:hypothetical protein